MSKKKKITISQEEYESLQSTITIPLTEYENLKSKADAVELLEIQLARLKGRIESLNDKGTWKSVLNNQLMYTSPELKNDQTLLGDWTYYDKKQ